MTNKMFLVGAYNPEDDRVENHTVRTAHAEAAKAIVEGVAAADGLALQVQWVTEAQFIGK